MYVAEENERALVRRQMSGKQVAYGGDLGRIARTAARSAKDARKRCATTTLPPQRGESTISRDGEQPGLGVLDASERRVCTKRRDERVLKQVFRERRVIDHRGEEPTDFALVCREQLFDTMRIPRHSGARRAHFAAHRLDSRLGGHIAR